MPSRSGLIAHRSWGLDSDTIIDWRSRAVCRPGGRHDPDMWVVEHAGLTPANERARELCKTCPVFADCDAFARRNRPVGVVMAGRWWHSRSTDGGTAERRCEHCARIFVAKVDSVARYCGNACRSQVSRAKAAAEKAAAEREAVTAALVVERFATLPVPIPPPDPVETAAAQKKRRRDLVVAFLPEVP